MDKSRTLNVWCNQQKIGVLAESNNLWQFQYTDNWHAFDLSPDLPVADGVIVDGASSRPVQWFFDNLLPEEGARDLLARDAHINKADAFGLLAHFGAESAGALTLLHEDEQPDEDKLQLLPQEVLSERINQLPHTPLSTGFSKRMSMAGAQHKLPIILKENELYEPVGATPSTHILKPDHSDPEQYPHSAANEWFTMQLAHKLGLDVPETFLIYVPEPVYLVTRFDRVIVEGRLQRQHILDGCQLLSLANTFKYAECTLESLERLVTFTRAKAVTRQRLLQWLIFNLIVGNTDDHLKNLSFYATNNEFKLTPHYDLISTAVYAADNQWSAERLVWPIGKARILGDVTPEDIEALANALRLSQRYTERTLKSMAAGIRKHSEVIIEELTHPDNGGNAREGELRLIRQIRYGVIEDMLNQLQC